MLQLEQIGDTKQNRNKAPNKGPQKKKKAEGDKNPRSIVCSLLFVFVSSERKQILPLRMEQKKGPFWTTGTNCDLVNPR